MFTAAVASCAVSMNSLIHSFRSHFHKPPIKYPISSFHFSNIFLNSPTSCAPMNVNWNFLPEPPLKELLKFNQNICNQSYGEEPTFEIERKPVIIDLESSDSELSADEATAPAMPQGSGLETEDISEVNLRSGKALSPRLSPMNKGKQIVVQEETTPPVEEVTSREDTDSLPNKVDYNIVAHLRKLPAKLSIFDALILSKEMREILIKALLDPEICLAQLTSMPEKEVCSLSEQPTITFTDEDLLLGTADHNKTLYIRVSFDRFLVSRVLVDPGASINIMSRLTLAYLNIDASKLSTDKKIIKGFNEKGERSLGSITLAMKTEELVTTAKFYIVDLKTSYNALLGRPWIHKYKLVPSSLHQCIKYCEDGREYTIKGDLQPPSMNMPPITLSEEDNFLSMFSDEQS